MVVVTYDETGVTFALDEASVARLRQHKGEDWIVSPVHIGHQTLDDFEHKPVAAVGGGPDDVTVVLVR